MPMKVLAIFSDLFLRSRVKELVAQTHGEARFADTIEGLKKLLDSYKPGIVVLDLSSSDYDAFSVAREVKTKSDAKLFGIFPHVRKDLKTKADDIGFDYVVPNSNFLTILRHILLKEVKQD